MQPVWYHTWQLSQATAGWLQRQALLQIPHGYFGERGPGFVWTSDESIKIIARKLKFFIFLGGSFCAKILNLDLRDPMEERTPKWDNLEKENVVWGRSELLYMSVLVDRWRWTYINRRPQRWSRSGIWKRKTWPSDLWKWQWCHWIWNVSTYHS